MDWRANKKTDTGWIIVYQGEATNAGLVNDNSSLRYIRFFDFKKQALDHSKKLSKEHPGIEYFVCKAETKMKTEVVEKIEFVETEL